MMEKRQPLQQMLQGKLDICMQKTETRFLSFTLYKCQFKVYLGPESLKLVQGRAENILKLIGIGNDFLNRTQKA
jgi:hypothetical protein